MEKTGFCDVGCQAVLCNFFGSVFFGESAAECKYGANFTDVH